MPDMPVHPPTDWIGYSIALRLGSPIHIGWRSIGNLKQTRPYVPGSALWGALSACLARDYLSNDFRSAEARVSSQMRLTYLYPSISPDRVTKWPWGAGRSEFEWLFLDSRVSTALQHGGIAERNFLHEIECISTFARDGSAVWLMGYCWTRPDWPLDQLRSLWSSVQVGGERTYGFGRIAEARIDPLNDGVFDDLDVELGDDVVLRAPGPHYLRAHVPEDLTFKDFADVEPLVGRNIDPRGRYNLTAAKDGVAAYAPGTNVAYPERWRITDRGLWRAYQG